MEINRNVLLPNLVTVGNGICGFAALVVLFKADVKPGGGPASAEASAYFAGAAWLILLGMVFDVFDGKVARMSGGSSALGAQLDSLCDLITFGLVPALMMLRLNMGYSPIWQRVVWSFSLAYFLGAMLRLARFTAENEPDEGAHLAFKGLPSPGAAGCISSLVLFYIYIYDFKEKELQWMSGMSELIKRDLQSAVAYIPVALPVLGLILGFTMVSNRLLFDHIGSRFFNRKHSFDFFVYVIFGVILVAVVPEIILPILFLGYLLYTPAKLALRHFFPARRAKVMDDLPRL
jgi:CDP-diacylglycerol--serine O-phosphatidyltransferase